MPLSVLALPHPPCSSPHPTTSTSTSTSVPQWLTRSDGGTTLALIHTSSCQVEGAQLLPQYFITSLIYSLFVSHLNNTLVFSPKNVSFLYLSPSETTSDSLRLRDHRWSSSSKSSKGNNNSSINNNNNGNKLS